MTQNLTRVLVLGASGMLGNAVVRVFSESANFEVFGSLRTSATLRNFPSEMALKFVVGYDLENHDNLVALFERVQPHVVVNCVGLVKQLAQADDPLQALPINSLLPHRLARLCSVANARLIHMSTDCVFSGSRGNYGESDHCDATDLYGRSKLLGEVDYPNAVTLRTSIIGHELNGSRSLINWFLSQNGVAKGFKKAIFSGLPTVEIACLIRDYVIPFPELRGLYHVSANPINKFDLLSLVAETYGKTIEIQADESFIIDRSLDSTRFRTATGFSPAPWPELVRRMHEFG
jgi:dTDP-4-dehydrorhamnose reductase